LFFEVALKIKTTPLFEVWWIGVGNQAVQHWRTAMNSKNLEQKFVQKKKYKKKKYNK
jgi:hypothetical protein